RASSSPTGRPAATPDPSEAGAARRDHASSLEPQRSSSHTPLVRRVLLVALAAGLCLAAGGSSARRPVMLGIFGPIDRFQGLTGQRSQGGHATFGWGQT